MRKAVSSLILIVFVSSASFSIQQQVRPLGLNELRKTIKNGKSPVLVNFWATWCEPCRDEFPDLVELDGVYRSRGLRTITITLDEPDRLKVIVPKFLTNMRATMPTYHLSVEQPEDAMSVVDPQWNGTLPATFLFDKHGKLVYKKVGRFKLSLLRQAIEQSIRAI
jgi:thiol-disulfide isomerase/thioredoxin